MKIYSFTTTGGELYEVHKLGGYYQLYKNGNHTQCMVPASQLVIVHSHLPGVDWPI